MQDKKPDDQEIKDALEQVLFTPAFLRSARQSKFLRYIIEQNLKKPNKALSSFDIAIDCFKRPITDDPNDAFIRNIASRTRRSLESHYDALRKLPAVVIQLASKGYSPIYLTPTESGPQPSTNSTAQLTPTTDSIDLNTPLPTLAVVPFQCSAGDHLHGVMGEVVSDELTTRLVRSKGMKVISRRTCARFTLSNHTTRELGQKLGADYIVEGKLYIHGNAIRLHTELSCCKSDEIIWADISHSTVEAVAGETDDMVEQMLYGVTRHLLDNELQRTASKPLSSLHCHSLMIGSSDFIHLNASNDLNQPKEMLEVETKKKSHQAALFAHLANWGKLHLAQEINNGENGQCRERLPKNSELTLEHNPRHLATLTESGALRSHFEENFHGAHIFYKQSIQNWPTTSTVSRLLFDTQVPSKELFKAGQAVTARSPQEYLTSDTSSRPPKILKKSTKC